MADRSIWLLDTTVVRHICAVADLVRNPEGDEKGPWVVDLLVKRDQYGYDRGVFSLEEVVVQPNEKFNLISAKYLSNQGYKGGGLVREWYGATVRVAEYWTDKDDNFVFRLLFRNDIELADADGRAVWSYVLDTTGIATLAS